MSLHFLDFEADFTAPHILVAYDELPLWSAMFGLLLLDEVPMADVRMVLDVGCGTGFPLIELAERLGPQAHVHGIDPWGPALARAREKIAARRTPNVTLHEGVITSTPFDNPKFDLIVSNLGVNNFDDRDAAIAECRRISLPGATLALTTNLVGHMREFYDLFASVLDAQERERLDAHIHHRATVASVRQLLESHGYAVTRVVEREGSMRFASGDALLNHHFIKLGFLDAWKQIVPRREREVFTRLRERLNAAGVLRLTIPMAYIEATAI